MATVKHYSITITPTVTPAEWFFHVRNIQDAVYQAGYDMRDTNDSDENGRLNILGMSSIDKFEGVVDRKGDPLDEQELRQIVEAYTLDREAAFTVSDMVFRDVDAPFEPIRTDGKNTAHYSIEVEPQLDPASWFFHVRSLAEYMAALGYCLDDFRDGDVLDREAVIKTGSQTGFEGFLRSDLSLDQPAIESHVRDYLDKHKLKLLQFSL